jgi:hypothetical protein
MKVLYRILKWILIAFVVVSCALAVRRCHHQSQIPDSISYNQLQPLVDGQIQLVLFHNKKRCHQCLQMEDFAEEVLIDRFGRGMENKSLVFKTITIDEPESQGLVRQFGIFAATLMLMEFNDDQLIYARVVTRGPELYQEENDFKEYLSQELSEILPASDE